MLIKGLQKTTLLDYPEHVACTLFTGGCNLRCPFCHNALLATRPSEAPDISEDYFFDFLEKRRGILDGVCITGGEPLIQKDIIPFIKRIKSVGLSVKLDTNGFYPLILNNIISENIVDYIAMDIKNSPSKYSQATGISCDCSEINESIKLIMNGGIPYEFRTTVVKELHTLEDITDIAQWIAGAEGYYLQTFKDSGDIISPGLSAHSEETMLEMRSEARRFVKVCDIRGM